MFVTALVCVLVMWADFLRAGPEKSYVFCGASSTMTGVDWTKPQKCCFVLFPSGTAGFSCDNLSLIIDIQNVKAKETEGGVSYLSCPSCVEL